jgi:hypothetical protein
MVAEIMASIRAKKALTNLIGNGGNKAQALRDAGYSAAIVDNPKKIIESKGFKELSDPILKKIEAESNRILEAAMGKDLDNERHKDLIDSLEKTTKLSQLLGGKATENIAMGVTGFNINIINDENKN